METRARYVLIGLFTVAAAFIGFAFVYWVQGKGGLGARAEYRVQFSGPVTGLTGGSAVLFNGVRVGEVTRLRLDRNDPRRLEAVIAIDAAAPVRVDTHAGVEFLGLTGSPVIALTGGAPAAAPLTGKDGEAPTLVADPDSGVSMMQAGRQVLQRLDNILSSNSDALHGTLSNLNTFSDALSRNSEKVDGIFAGLERLTGGGKKGPTLIYDLTALKEAPAGATAPKGLMTVPEPTAVQSFNSEKIQARPQVDGKPALDGYQWADNLPIVVQDKVLQSFENAGFGQSVVKPADGVTADYQLMLNIRGFQVDTKGEPTAVVELAAKVVASGGKVVGARVFRQELQVPARSVESKVVATTLDEAFGKAVRELEPWALELASQPAPEKSADKG